MTLQEFSEDRELDWKLVFDFLKDYGVIIEEHPDTTIPKEWLLEVIREFSTSTDADEQTSEIPAEVISVLDKETQKKLEEEKANAYLRNDKFDTSQVDIDIKRLAFDILIQRLKHGEIKLDPEYQRTANLWPLDQQSRFIESILIKLPLPAFYFDGQDDGNWVVVDGLQRLSAIKNFILDGMKLSKLDFLKGLEGMTYEELPRPLQRRIAETTIFAFIIKAGTPDDLKYYIFKRINTGGLTLTPQEIRHVLNPGMPAQLLKDLAGLDVFKKATRYALSSKRMLDRDFVNRFIAFLLLGYKDYEKGYNDVDGFLNKGLALVKADNINYITERFEQAMETAWEIFGSDAFRKRTDYPPERRRKPLNKALFEVWSVNLAKLSEKDCQKLVELREKVVEESCRLLREDAYFDISITYSTGDGSRVKYRFEQIEKLIQRILHDINHD